VPKRFKLIPDPKCPLAITLRIAEEDFRHGALSCVGNRSATANRHNATTPLAGCIRLRLDSRKDAARSFTAAFAIPRTPSS
jgi:hypothetical protein